MNFRGLVCFLEEDNLLPEDEPNREEET